MAHPTTATQRRIGLSFGAVLVGTAVLLFLALAGFMKSLERRAIAGTAVHEQLTASGTPRPLAEVAQSIRQLKLVTVEVDTSVTSQTNDSNWRGDVAARVAAPAKLLYGTDLSAMRVESMLSSPVDGGILVRIPAPERIATEVAGESEDVNVSTGGLRLRSMAGEYFLGLARRNLHLRAAETVLSPQDARMVRQATREQATAMVRQIVGPRTPVVVVYEDGEP